MKKLRSYSENLDDFTGTEWDRREIDTDRCSSRRRYYMKSGSIRRPLSLYDRSVEDDRDAGRISRKRFEHELDGFDRRKVFDRYRDGGSGSGSGGGIDLPMHASSFRGSYGSERMHRSESCSAIRNDFPKGFRSERDRSRRDGCGGLSWRRLSCGKEISDEEKRSPGWDSGDMCKTRQSGLSSGDHARDLEEVRAEMEKIRRESCSSSEMEEGEFEPDPLPDASTEIGECQVVKSQCFKDELNFQEATMEIDSIKPMAETNSENKIVGLSLEKSDCVDRTFCGERSMEMEVDEINGNVSLHEEHNDIEKELGEERRRGGEGFIEKTGKSERLDAREEEVKCLIKIIDVARNFTEDTPKVEIVDDAYYGKSSHLPSHVPNLEVKHQIEDEVIEDNELVNTLTSSLERNLEEKEIEDVIEAKVDAEEKEDMNFNLEIMQMKEREANQVGFEAEQRKGKTIHVQVPNYEETDRCNSANKINHENHTVETLRDKGKRIAHSVSSMADSVEEEDALEGSTYRGFELFFHDHVSQPGMGDTCEIFGGKMKTEKFNLELLDLTLGLPGTQPDTCTKPPNSFPSSPGPTKSIQSFPSSFRTVSDGFTNSISFSSSQLFLHNPSCSLTQNTMDNFEQTVVSHPIFPAIDQVSSGNIWQSQSSVEHKRKGGAGTLFHKVLMNGNHSQNSSQCTNARNFLNINSVSRQQSFSRQSSPPQSVGSHDTQSEHSKDKRKLSKERSFNSLIRSEQNTFEGLITKIVSEPLKVIERMLQGMNDYSTQHLKDFVGKLLENAEKQRQIHALQSALQRRSDLTAESLAKCPLTLLEILVALKTGLPAFIQRSNNASSSDLVDIYQNLKCCNIACRNMLPVDDCDCKICSQKNGFCSACMCLFCFKFDMASNTCSWVGCDVCLHWCHTVCGLRCSYIRNGRISSAALSATEMQFHCVACGHPSEMFGFVKEVFKTCSKDWKVENLAKELQYVRRIFCASNDVRGKSLYQFAGQMLVKLEDKKMHFEVVKNILSYLLESESFITKATPPSENNDPSAIPPALPIDDTAPWLLQVSKSKPSHVSPKSAASTHDDDQMCRKRKDAAILPVKFEKKPIIADDLDSVIGFKQAEAAMYQVRADNARKEAAGLKRISAAKNEKIDDEYSSRMAKLQMKEAEENRRLKFEELQAIEKAHHDFISLKTRMEAEIKGLLVKMEATLPNFNA